MRVVSVVGARPQFVKLAVLCRRFEANPQILHAIVHTGQHYDDAMSGSFFRDLGIPPPHHNLEVGSASHARQTAQMIQRLEGVLESLHPDWILLYGDTNSTLAGAVTAAKMHLKLAHVEAGLRSFNRSMPEEVNRIVADHLSDLLFCPTAAGMRNLCREGLEERAVLSGDVMYDALLANVRQFETHCGNSPACALADRSYALATVHRAENTDDRERLSSILHALERIGAEICRVVLAVHPRTRKALDGMLWRPLNVSVLPPLGYRDMLLFEKRARMILTDSGGVQKEAYFLHVPCVTMRDETEWTETLENSCNALAGADADRIVEAARGTCSAGPWGSHYGSGEAGRIIVDELIARCGKTCSSVSCRSDAAALESAVKS